MALRPDPVWTAGEDGLESRQLYLFNLVLLLSDDSDKEYTLFICLVSLYTSFAS